jgi:chorismate synthase
LEQEPVKEATELKPLGDKSKVLQNKNNKVGGSPKVHGGKAHGGDIESDPKLKPAKSFDKALQSVKGKPEVKSTVKKGEFFK